MLTPTGFEPVASTPAVPSPTINIGVWKRLPSLHPGGAEVKKRPVCGTSNKSSHCPPAVLRIWRLLEREKVTLSPRTPGTISESKLVLCPTTGAGCLASACHAAFHKSGSNRNET